MTTDWNDSNTLSERANQIIQISNQYHKTRKMWADAKLLLDMKVAVAYKHKEIEKKMSYDKALLSIYEVALTNEDKVIIDAYIDYVRLEADYKGLEKVLESHQNRISLCQSLIKNQLRNT